MLKLSRFVFVAVSALISIPAQAHVELGTYQGLTAARIGCSVEIKSIEFENGAPHPLNERVTISYEGTTYRLGHAPVVDTGAGTVRFNHDDLRAVIATETGAKAIILKISHDEKKEGPTELLILEDNYSDATQNQRTSCGELEHVAAPRATSGDAFHAVLGKNLLNKSADPSSAVQYIDCSDMDPMSNDKIIISLRANDVGTLFISNGVDAPEPNNSGVLALHRSDRQDRSAQPATMIAYVAKNTVAGFRVSIPADVMGKRADSFSVSLDAQRDDGSFQHAEDFVCFSRMY